MVFGGRTWEYFPPLMLNNDSWFNDGELFEEGLWSTEVLSKVVDEARVSASSCGVIKQPFFLFLLSVVLR